MRYLADGYLEPDNRHERARLHDPTTAVVTTSYDNAYFDCFESPIEDLQAWVDQAALRVGAATSRFLPVYLVRNQLWSVTKQEDATVKRDANGAIEFSDLHLLLQAEARKRAAKVARALNEAKRIVTADFELPDEIRRQPIPRDVRMFVWQRDGGRCVECQTNAELEFDHIIAVSMGGSNTERNLQLLCGRCNRLKGATLG